MRYSILLLVLVVVLAGCELQRPEGDAGDAAPVSDLPPTLAPLGAETDLEVEATPIPTIINVQPTATQSSLADGDAAPAEPVAPTSEAVELSGSTAASSEAVEASAVSEETEAETFTPPAAEEEAAEEPAATESIVVDATTSEELPTGGPVAVNPPASQTAGDYAVASGQTSYTVRPGDTLFSIATRYGTSVAAIAQANGLPSDLIYVGQELNIPAGDSVEYGAPADDYSAPIAPPDNYNAPTNEQPYYGDAENQHVVAPGETLFRIALQYNTSVDAIAGANGIPYPYFIQAGQTLVIPAPGEYVEPPPPEGGYYYEEEQPYQQYPPQDDSYAPVPGNANTHTVAPGETLFSIAQRYGTTADALASANGLFNPNQIYVGQVLYLP